MTRFLPLVLLVACTGCGTVVNLVTPVQEGKVYGGVKTDVDLIQKLFDGSTASTGPLASPSQGVGSLFAVACVVLPFMDLPLSLLGDTLTLPLTRWLDDR